mmetsp:Transcript_5833/g.14413  ORF Transcript_5833/g.14413 Transcript_5833/m.14413 type:complete len:235 (-) Transcript_5833:371-1075(-)
MRQHLATEALEETNGLVCVHATGEDVGHGRARLALVHVDADDAVFADSSVRPNIVIGLAVQPACGVTGILFELQGLELQGRVWLVRPAAMRIIEDVQIHDTRLDCRRRRGYNGREHTHRSEHAERRHCGRNGRRRRRLRSRRGGGAGGCAALVAWPLPEPTGAAAADPRQAPRRQQQGSQRQREPRRCRPAAAAADEPQAPAAADDGGLQTAAEGGGRGGTAKAGAEALCKSLA